VCPVFPGAVERLRWPLEDPAREGQPREQNLTAFRRARDTILEALQEIFPKPQANRD
jgi:hypothetical protein